MYDNPAPSPGMSKKSRFGIGCAVAAFIAFALTCGGIILAGYLGWGVIEREMEKFAGPFEAEGYVRVVAQDVQVTTPPQQSMVYVAQNVTIAVPVQVNLAILGQVATIEQDVEGDVVFLGQILTIMPGVTINGDLEVRGAQLVRMNGTVTGKTTGAWQTWEGTPPNVNVQEPDEDPDDEDFGEDG